LVVLVMRNEWAGQWLARRKPSSPSSKPSRRPTATSAMVLSQSLLLRQLRAPRTVLKPRGKIFPDEIAPMRSRQQNRLDNDRRPSRRQRAAIAPVIRPATLSEPRTVLVAPASSQEGSARDVPAFGSAETSAPSFRRLLAIGDRARHFEPISHRRQPMPTRLGVY
jgi:hypothetical protein